MVWEVRTKTIGEWTEAKMAVARDGENYSSIGQLMMRSDEWRDFAKRFGLREGDGGVWRSN